MNNKSLLTLQRAALPLLLLGPTAACAKSQDQSAPSQQNSGAPAKGASLSTLMSRHEKKLLAADTDGDGRVSRTEFLASTKAGKGDPAKRFAKLDSNGDGALDKAEINMMLSRRFKRLDTNGDGVLSADERATANARKNDDASGGRAF